jgi:hypothetical protein
MRTIILVAAISLLSACNSSPEMQEVPLVIVVDARGAPIKGALVMPESEDEGMTNADKLSSSEFDRRTSDARGLVRADLRAYYWPSDGCYHFAATKQGYEDAEVSVSKDLFPSPLRIKMDAAGNAESANPSHKASTPPAN